MTILLTVLATLVVVILALNLHTPEKEIRHQVEHYHDILDPQFRREMGALLGPSPQRSARLLLRRISIGQARWAMSLRKP
jgi:hypothetical protein